MAKFTLSLLTTVADSSSNGYTRTIITEYVNNRQAYAERKKPAASLIITYNEKLSLHQNSQKELTFNMLRKLNLGDDWVLNPYVDQLHVGSLLELEDKYGRVSLFIINKIAFAFKSINLEYQYTCQDAFSYQHSRQQSGYTITNDASKDDYIGPKSLDWWVIRKIAPECRIQYEYIPLEVGLYQDATGDIVRFTSKERTNWDSTTQRAIIKEPFTAIVDGIDEYQQTFAFSCSSATASSALISLGDTLDLMVHAAEYRQDDGAYARYFWFEPKNNQEVTDIKYSPDHDISKFDLSFSGDSLTTVLNVNSNEVGDELVALLPNTPGFFTQMFSDPAQWSIDLPYHPGFFTTANRKTYSFEPVISDIDLPEGYVGVKLGSLHLPSQLEQFQFAWDENKYTVLQFSQSSTSVTISSNTTSIYLFIKTTDRTILLKEGNEIPFDLKGKDCDLYCVVPLNGEWTYTSGTVYFTLYHLFTDEEREFAEAAETCPWLENKLIDFSYFLKQNILTPHEYSTLLSKFTNDLRVINGRLLYYTDAYYRALSSKVEMISTMQNNIDALHAQLEADVISPVTTGVRKPSLVDFTTAYQTLFTPTSTKTPVLNYKELVADYFEKYLNAEQKFLKNVYAFREYFNSLVSFSGNFIIYDNDISATLPVLSNQPIYFLGLDKIPLAHGAKVTYQAPVYKKLNNGHFKNELLVNETNYQNFYVSAVGSGGFNLLADLQNYSYNYNSNDKYYLTQTKFQELFPNQIGESTYWDGSTIYVQLTTEQLSRLILTKHFQKYYVRDTTRYVPLDYVRLDLSDAVNTIGWMAMPKLANYWLTGETTWGSIPSDRMLTWNVSGQSSTGYSKDQHFVWEYYKSYFPLTSVYFYGAVYKTTETTNKDGNTLVSMNRINSKGLTQKEYAKKLAAGEITDSEIAPSDYNAYQAVTFIGGGYLLIDWGSCSNSATETLRNTLISTFPYSSYSSPASSLYYSIYTSRTIEASHPLNKILQDSEGGDAAQMWNLYTMGDSYYVNYFNSDSDRMALARWTRNYYQAYSATPDFVAYNANNTWYQNPTTDVIDTSALDESAPYGSQYFNFYKYAALSYSFRRRERGSTLYSFVDDNIQHPLYIKNKYLHALKSTDKVNLSDAYVRIPLWGDRDNTTWTTPTSDSKLIADSRYIYALYGGDRVVDDTLFKGRWTRRFSAISWYPFDKLKETVVWTKDASWSGATAVPLSTAIASSLKKGEQIESIGDNGLVTIVTDTSIVGYIYCHIENYEKGLIQPSANDVYNNPEDYTISALNTSISLSQVFDTTSDELITVTDIEQCLKPFKDMLYILPGEVRSFVRISDQGGAYSDYRQIQMYDKDADGNFNKVYSLEQLNDAAVATVGSVLTTKDLDSYYTFAKTHTHLTTYTDDLSSIRVELFACVLEPQEDKTWALTSTSLGYKTIALSLDSATAISKTYKNQQYTSDISITRTSTDCSNLTNGQFWYKYHNQTEIQTLFEQAAAIETQLQTYWDQAYTASKYCRYFLPSAWQTYYESADNFFSKDIIVAGKDGSVTLSRKFLPEVKIYTDTANESTLSMFVNKHYLPKYDWVLASSIESDISYTSANENVLATHDSDNYIDPSLAPLITNNSAIQQAMSHLKTTLSDWRVVKNGYMTYYYALSGGMEWKDVPNYIGNDKSYELLDGQYGIFYYLLTTNYTSRNMSEYESLKREQLRFWQNIHDQYPYLILEDNYSYSLATTSAELMQMAKLIFKGKVQPERNYSLTIIDVASLENYKGQELLPGQGISLDAYRYYQSDDDVYRALSQYLFISDVSYSLRDDSSIQLTVDSMKYQEKLLQSLVSLIK